MKKIITLLFLITLFSCEKNQQFIEDPDNILIGNWVNAVYKDNKTTFSRANNLPKNNHSISFKLNGNYIEKSSGWCGTPPLSFFDVNGTYQLKDSLITINKDNYSLTFAWRIVSLTATTLVVEKELTDQEIAHQKLMELYNKISTLAYSEPCSSSLNWSFVGYGSKSCGGFQGFIPYSKNIDTVTLFQKIEAYTKAEKEYNLKYNIISNCTLAAKPTAVVCQNDYPTLKY